MLHDEHLILSRHLEWARKLFRQYRHYGFFAMYQKGLLNAGDAASPFDQLLLIGVRRKSVNRMHSRPHRDRLAKQVNFVRAVDNLPRQRAVSGEADENDARFRPPEVVA